MLVNESEIFTKPKNVNVIKKEISNAAFEKYFRDEYYLKIYKNRESGKYGFNKWAALYSVVWCIYKKLYGLLAIYIVYYFLAMPTIAYIINEYTNFPKNIEIAMLMAGIFFPILVMGFVANRKYIEKAQKDVEKIVNSPLPEKYFEDAQLSAGEPNTSGAITFFVVSALLRAVYENFQNSL